jgi:hypothetical protein
MLKQVEQPMRTSLPAAPGEENRDGIRPDRETADRRVHFARFQWLAAPFPSRSLFLAPKSRFRVAYEKRQPGLISVLKNNSNRQPSWQEIVDFS